jgi:hypothetical protein
VHDADTGQPLADVNITMIASDGTGLVHAVRSAAPYGDYWRLLAPSTVPYTVGI